jgi:hypothetical protein
MICWCSHSAYLFFFTGMRAKEGAISWVLLRCLGYSNEGIEHHHSVQLSNISDENAMAHVLSLMNPVNRKVVGRYVYVYVCGGRWCSV